VVIGHWSNRRSEACDFDQILKVGHVLDKNQVKNDANSDFVLCRDCSNFKTDSSESKTGRCDHMPESIVSEDCGCLGGRATLLVL
jgi:hypothetical protein